MYCYKNIRSASKANDWTAPPAKGIAAPVTVSVKPIQRAVQMRSGSGNFAALHNKLAQRIDFRRNNTGLPDNLKAGIETLSGYSLDDVRVHYNSPRPAQLKALAYTNGTDIHVAPGQEKCLPHEAWHVAQQKQRRVAPTATINGINVNTEKSLEHEADVMGAKALQCRFMSINGLAHRQTTENCVQGCGMEQQQIDLLHKLFSHSYSTATFQRQNFTDEDRIKAWREYAKAECERSGRIFVEKKFMKNIRKMGLTAKGLQLRHIIPYSDIAGVFHIATSDTALRIADQDYVTEVRKQVLELSKILGVSQTWLRKNDFLDVEKWNGCLHSSSRRNLFRELYRKNAHSPKNLFHAGGSANMAIGNRPDVIEDTVGIFGQRHVNRLMDWWEKTMKLLYLNPVLENANIYNTTLGRYVTVPLRSHDLSRPLGAFSGGIDEISGIV